MTAFCQGQRVEVWFDGFRRWLPGTVQEVGALEGFSVARVRLDGYAEPSVYRLDQMQPLKMGGLFSLEKGEGVCD